MTPSCWLVSSATVFAVASMTSASAVSTLSEPTCPIPQSWSQEPVHVGVEVGITPWRMKRWRDRPRHTLPRDPVSACLPPTPLHRCIGLRVRSLNDPHDARLRPFNRHTLEPAAASGANSTHPSPSARQFRLLLNRLVTSELRRVFCDLYRPAAALFSARSCFSVSAADTFTSVHRFKGSIPQ